MKAFTLVELMVVFGIIALSIGLSIFGLTRFRANVELNTSYTNVISFINELKNKSSNAFGSSNSGVLQSIDLFGVSFNNNIVTPLICDASFDSSNYNCRPSGESLVDLGSVNVNPIGCFNRFGFKRLSSDLIALDAAGGVIQSGVCVLELTHTFTNEVKTITIDLVKNTYN